MTDEEETPVPLPSAPVIRLAGNATLQPPLTRRGHGPGLIIITPGDLNVPKEKQEGEYRSDDRNPKTLDPLPQKKWAEEGYAVLQLSFGDGEPGTEEWDIGTAFDRAIDALTTLETCDVKDRFGLIGTEAISELLFSYTYITYPNHCARPCPNQYDYINHLVSLICHMPKT